MAVMDESKKLNNENLNEVIGGYMDWHDINYIGDDGAYQVVITCPNCGCATPIATLNRKNTCSIPLHFECPQCHSFKKDLEIKNTNPDEGPYVIWSTKGYW